MFTTNWYETAHQKLKLNYPKFMFGASVAAVVVCGLGMAFSPPYVESPYQLREKKMSAVTISEQIYIPPPPKEFAAPELPVQEIEASDDADAEDTIGITDFNPFEPPSIPQASSSAPEEFVAFDSPPEVVYSEAPEYPEMAQESEASGTVWVIVVINEEGKVVSAEISESDAAPALEEAAIEAAYKFLFNPAKQRDRAVRCRIMIPFDFGLEG
jgi:TonB family protein